MIQNMKLLNGALLTAIVLLLIIPAYAPSTIITDTSITTTTVNAVDVKASHQVNATNNMFINANRVLTTADKRSGFVQIWQDGVRTINDPFPPILIAATTKPSAPQYTKTLQSVNIPTFGNATYMAMITTSGKNNSTNTSTCNVLQLVGTKNGIEVGQSTSVFVCPGSPSSFGPFWSASWLISIDQDVHAGDVIGLKLWADTSNIFYFANVNIYIFPRTITATNDVSVLLGARSVVGNITNVFYVANPLSYKIIEGIDEIAFPIGDVNGTSTTLLKNQVVKFCNSSPCASGNAGTAVALPFVPLERLDGIQLTGISFMRAISIG